MPAYARLRTAKRHRGRVRRKYRDALGFTSDAFSSLFVASKKAPPCFRSVPPTDLVDGKGKECGRSVLS